MTQCSGSNTIMTQQGSEIFTSQYYVIGPMRCIAVYGYKHPEHGGSRYFQKFVTAYQGSWHHISGDDSRAINNCFLLTH